MYELLGCFFFLHLNQGLETHDYRSKNCRDPHSGLPGKWWVCPNQLQMRIKSLNARAECKELSFPTKSRSHWLVTCVRSWLGILSQKLYQRSNIEDMQVSVELSDLQKGQRMWRVKGGPKPDRVATGQRTQIRCHRAHRVSHVCLGSIQGHGRERKIESQKRDKGGSSLEPVSSRHWESLVGTLLISCPSEQFLSGKMEAM